MNEIPYQTELTDETGFVLPVEFRISFDHTPYERSTWDSPGCAETVDVNCAVVWAGALRLGPHPDPKALEHLVWAHINAERERAALVRAENTTQLAA